MLPMPVMPDNTVADLLCDIEERAFKDGLYYGIDLMTGRIFDGY